MDFNKSSSEIIKQLKLSPHPEWGWFREILRSENLVNWNDGEKKTILLVIFITFVRVKKVNGTE